MNQYLEGLNQIGLANTLPTDTLTPPSFDGNPFRSYLGDVPQAAYFSFQDQFGQTPRGVTSPGQRQYFQNQFQNIHNQFMGQLGEQLRRGQAPTRQFTDFLSERIPQGGRTEGVPVAPTRPIPFAERFASLPPILRGDYSASRLSPRGRFLFF